MKIIINWILRLFGSSEDVDRWLNNLSTGVIQGLALASGVIGLLLAPLPVIGLISPLFAIALGSIAIAIAGDRPKHLGAVGLVLGLVGALINLVVLVWLVN